MTSIDKKKLLRPSILDRLIDNEPHLHIEADSGQFQKIKNLRQSVRLDLENLLNTRFRIVSPPEELEHLEQSLLNYGLPDLATININSAVDKKAFTMNLEKLLRTFEPRFKSVRVNYRENNDKQNRTLRFRIDAVLYADPSPEHVVFDSILEPISRTVSIEET